MSERRGLPDSTRMRHDSHFVEELATRHTQAVGQMIPVSRIHPNPDQPRQLFEQIDELVASIQRVGVLQPLLVRHAEDGFEIISGERRYRASQEAGLPEVPCIVLEVDDARALEIALIENLQRLDLSPFEEAEGLQALIDQFGLTHDEVAERISKSRTSVTETVTLANMPRMVRDILEGTEVRSKSVILEIARSEDEQEMIALAERAVRHGLTRDQIRNARRAARRKVAAAATAEADADASAPPDQAATEDETDAPRRMSFRSRAGITVTIDLGASHVSLSDVERSLLEAVRSLRSHGLPH